MWASRPTGKGRLALPPRWTHALLSKEIIVVFLFAPSRMAVTAQFVCSPATSAYIAEIWPRCGNRRSGKTWAVHLLGSVPKDNHVPEMHWVAAESLDAALLYLRKRHDDFMITEARFLGMIPLLSGSPLD